MITRLELALAWLSFKKGNFKQCYIFLSGNGFDMHTYIKEVAKK